MRVRSVGFEPGAFSKTSAGTALPLNGRMGKKLKIWVCLWLAWVPAIGGFGQGSALVDLDGRIAWGAGVQCLQLECHNTEATDWRGRLVVDSAERMVTDLFLSSHTTKLLSLPIVAQGSLAIHARLIDTDGKTVDDWRGIARESTNENLCWCLILEDSANAPEHHRSVQWLKSTNAGMRGEEGQMGFRWDSADRDAWPEEPALLLGVDLIMISSELLAADHPGLCAVLRAYVGVGGILLVSPLSQGLHWGKSWTDWWTDAELSEAPAGIHAWGMGEVRFLPMDPRSEAIEEEIALPFLEGWADCYRGDIPGYLKSRRWDWYPKEVSQDWMQYRPMLAVLFGFLVLFMIPAMWIMYRRRRLPDLVWVGPLLAVVASMVLLIVGKSMQSTAIRGAWLRVIQWPSLSEGQVDGTVHGIEYAWSIFAPAVNGRLELDRLETHLVTGYGFEEIRWDRGADVGRMKLEMQGARRYNLESNRMIELPQVWGRVKITGVGEDGALMGRFRWRFPEGWRALRGIVSYADHVWGVRLEGRQAGEAELEPIEDHFTKEEWLREWRRRQGSTPRWRWDRQAELRVQFEAGAVEPGPIPRVGGSSSDIDWAVEESMVFIALGEPEWDLGSSVRGTNLVFSDLDGFGSSRWLGLDHDKPRGSDPNLYDSFTESYQEFLWAGSHYFRLQPVVQELVSMDQGYILRWDLAEVEPGCTIDLYHWRLGKWLRLTDQQAVLDPVADYLSPGTGSLRFRLIVPDEIGTGALGLSAVRLEAK